MMRIWTDQDIEQVAGLLTSFNGAAEVCAVTDCKESELDELCRAAFDMTFKETEEHFHAQGRAMVRKALFEQALEGSAKAMDMLAREQLGMGPVETRKRTMGAKGGKDDGDRDATNVLALVQSRRKNRRDQATA